MLSFRFRTLNAVFVLLSLLAALPSAADTVTTRSLAAGITYTQEIHTGALPQIINILKIDLHAPGVRVRCGQALDTISLAGPTKGREVIHSLANRNGAIAAVNADFFPFTGDPLGVAIRDGELLSEPMEFRACLGIGPDAVYMDVLGTVGAIAVGENPPLPLNGINRTPEGNSTLVLTPSYSATPKIDKSALLIVLGDVPLPVRVSTVMRGQVESVTAIASGQTLPVVPANSVYIVATGTNAAALAGQFKTGDNVAFRFDLVSNLPAPQRGKYASRGGLRSDVALAPIWKDVEQAVGGGPRLVVNGQIQIDGDAEDIPLKDFVIKRHPRTAVGATKDGALLLVTVDGRQAFSDGMSLAEMAALMIRLGAENAMNLDGGGSSTMVVQGSVVNAPSDGRERAVANGLLVYGTQADAGDLGDLQLRSASTFADLIEPGKPIKFAVTGPDGTPIARDTPIYWGTGDGLGFISQEGVFTGYHAGKGTLRAQVGKRLLEVPIEVKAGSAAKLTATLGSVANNPPDRNALTVTVTDKYGNAVVGVKVNAKVQGGQLEASLITDAKGIARSEVVWDAAPGGRKVTVSSPGTNAVAISK